VLVSAIYNDGAVVLEDEEAKVTMMGFMVGFAMLKMVEVTYIRLPRLLSYPIGILGLGLELLRQAAS